MAETTNLFDTVRIGIASPQDVRSWSHGEVKKPETINYRTFKPEFDGLFCQRIFGPVKDWECSCGKYKKIKYRGIVCERCGVEVTRSRVRRERMGHIELAAPVCHIWYLKGLPSPLAHIVNISPKQLEKVIYFTSFIIIDLDQDKIEEMMPSILQAVEEEKAAIQEQMVELETESLERLAVEMVQNPDEYFDENYVRERMKANYDRIRAEYRDADDRIKDLDVAAAILRDLEMYELIEEDKWRAISKLLLAVGRRLKKDLDELVRANIGADAVKELLRRVDLEQLIKDLRREIVETSSQRRKRAIKRLELAEALFNSKSRPEWMILEVVPVISPELRPMVQLDGGRFATSDLNDLYRRIINRNNRLRKIIDIQAPESIINHEKRLLQESVDALIDNGRRQRPVVGSNQRPLKSLSDMLKGKEGRFRKNLLGKRVDYSGRSVIVVGPNLKLSQCGLPKEMALELFKPFVMHELVDGNVTQNIKTAKRMIERMHPAVWDALEKVIKEHPVLLNRAPTLHRLGIQAFEPILVEGKAIQLHPLVCHAYNADFDGDQMAVHVPLSMQAQAEARVLMLSTQNLFSPADGQPVMSPIQDIVLGCYALTFTNIESQGGLERQKQAHERSQERNSAPHIYNSPESVLLHLEHVDVSKRVGLNDMIRVRLKRPVFRPQNEVDHRDPDTGVEYVAETTTNEFDEQVTELKPLTQQIDTVVVETTPGRLIFNEQLPYPLRYSDHYLTLELSRKAISSVIVDCHDLVGIEGTIRLLDDIKALGFKWATKYGLTIALTDMDPPARREEMLDEADERSERILHQYRVGMMSFGEMQRNLQTLWKDTYDEIGDAIVNNMDQLNPLAIMTQSGAKGSQKQLAQLSGMRGLMFNQFNEVIYELPVRSSFQKGLKMLEFFVTTHGARKGLADTALRTADAGYLTRRLVDVAQDVIIRAEDCGTTEGMLLTKVVIDSKTIETIGDRMFRRKIQSTLKNPATGETIFKKDEFADRKRCDAVNAAEREFSERASSLDSEKLEELHEEYRSAGWGVSEHGLLGVVTRSPITCELARGVCSACYGIDLATQKPVEVGVAVGIIAAQSIGEPGTQLTMRTFHTGGVAGAKAIARTNQFKTSKFIRQFTDDFRSATNTSEDEFDPGKLLQSQQKTVAAAMDRQSLADEIEKDKKPHKRTKAEERAIDKMDSDSRKMWERNRKTFFYSWSGESSGIVRVEEIFEARKQPRGKAIICPVSGFVADIKKSSFGRWVVVEAELALEDAIREAYVSDRQDWEIKGTIKKNGKSIPVYDAALERLIGQKLTSPTVTVLRRHKVKRVNIIYPILVPPTGDLPVAAGDRVIKGDPLTDGPLDPHEVLELAGAHAVHHYFVQNLQAVYKDQGVDINDRHLEVIIRQMLRKRRIVEPGDTPYLPGQMVDRFELVDANQAVRDKIKQGKKVRFKDPETGEEKERRQKEATASWILLGITEASLATDSYLSAASFLKTTRVLTEAAVCGRVDHLHGLKENVIIGRAIPAGTGVAQYRALGIEADKSTPAWSTQPLSALADDGDAEEISRFVELDEMSLEDLASEDTPTIDGDKVAAIDE